MDEELRLEKPVAYMKSKQSVWFATTEQMASYVKQQANQAGPRGETVR